MMPALLFVWTYTDETLDILELGHHMVGEHQCQQEGEGKEIWDWALCV